MRESRLRPPASVGSSFGVDEESAMQRIGRQTDTLQIRPTPPVPVAENEFSSDSSDEHFNRLAQRLSRIEDALIKQAGREWQSAFNFSTDASGNAGGLTGVMLYEHKEGFVVDITQVIFWLDGQTPASVFSTANAFAAIYKGAINPANLIAYTPQPGASTVFPLTINIPNDVPPVLRMNDRVVASVGGSVGGLANKNITVILNGTIKRELGHGNNGG